MADTAVVNASPLIPLARAGRVELIDAATHPPVEERGKTDRCCLLGRFPGAPRWIEHMNEPQKAR